jgi:hypothetical protein
MHFAAPILLSLSVLVAAADPFPSGWAAENLKPVGYSGLDGHGGAFNIVVRRAGDKWYAYLGHFWESGWIILDVTDAAKPLLFLHGEATGGGDQPDGTPKACTSPLAIAAMIDIRNEARPRLMSLFPTPAPPKNLPYTDFCDKGGRFGPHNTNLEYHLPDVEKQGDLIYLTYFNAGLRLYDIKDPQLPKEVGWFVPPPPVKRYGLLPYDKLVSQTEDVLVDTRGNIYITDKNWGLFIIRQAR